MSENRKPKKVVLTLGAVISGVFIVFVFCFLSTARAAQEPLTQQAVISVVQKIRGDAEKEIVASLGRSNFELLENAVKQEYPVSQFSNSGPAGCCPGFGSSDPQEGLIIQTQILNQSGVYFVVGAEAVLKGSPSVAKWAFANASALCPMCPLHLSNLAFVLNLEKDYITAILLLETAKSIDPTLGSIYVNLAYSYQNLKKYEEAIQGYLVAIALNPQITKYHQMLISVQKIKEKQKEMPVTARDQNPNQQDKRVDLQQALNLLKEKKTEERKEEPSTGVKMNPAQGGGPRSLTSGAGDQHFHAGPNESIGDSVIMRLYPDLELGITILEEGAKSANLRAAEYPPGSKWYKFHKIVEAEFLIWADLCRLELMKLMGKKPEGDVSDDVSDWFARAFEDLSMLDQMGEMGDGPQSGEKHKFWFGPITIEEGADGTFKLGVSAGILGGELKYNPETYNFGAKASFGPQLNVGIGPVGVSGEAEVYFEVDLEKGPVVGAKGKITAGPSLGDVKIPGEEKFPLAPARLEQEIDIVQPYELSKLSFENIFK
jgi:tetratricopeptide (TPR) repeat protein